MPDAKECALLLLLLIQARETSPESRCPAPWSARFLSDECRVGFSEVDASLLLVPIRPGVPQTETFMRLSLSCFQSATKQRKNMKKISWTILWLSLHPPKTLKNGYIRAVFSLFPHLDLAITSTATWPPDSTSYDVLVHLMMALQGDEGTG
jgi:hypothetical protein